MGWTVKAQDSLRTVNLDEVVITGTKTEVPIEKSGKTIFKLTRKDIEANSGKSVADLLNEVPGVQMDGNFGPVGTNISYFVRGAPGKRTLILIDGIPFNDPSGIDQTYDLRLLNLNQVESIEILKGGLSSLYGTGAAAGVINITLKKPGKEELTGNIGVEYGSFNTWSPHLGIGGTRSALSYFFNGSYRSSDGFSAAQDQSGTNNFDKDGFKSYNILARVGYDFSELFKLGVTASLDDFDTDFDGGAFSDGDHTSEYRQWRVGLSPKLKWHNGKLKADLFYSKLDRLFNSPDFLDPSQRFIDDYDSENIQADFVLDQNLNSNLKLIGGLNYQGMSYSQPAVREENFSTMDPYVSLIFDQSNFNIQLGSRVNNHSEYGSHLVYNFNPSYIHAIDDIKDLKFISSWSTSFIAPSLFQLYGPFGNLELKPEESASVEAGFGFFTSQVKLNAVYFFRKDENLIDFRSSFDNQGNFAGEYFNSVSEIETDGIELDAGYIISSSLNIAANYTYVQSRNDIVLYRIPESKYGASISWQPVESASIGLKYLHTGDRIQQVFNNTTFAVDNVKTEAFDLLDLTGSYRVKDLIIRASINNLTNEAYTAIVGFNTIGRNYRVGVSYGF